MSENLNPGAQEQMVEKLSHQELMTLFQTRTNVQLMELQLALAKCNWDKLLLELRVKYNLKETDGVDSNTGVINRGK